MAAAPSPADQAALLGDAMASPSRALPAPLLAAAVPYFQNPNLSAVQLHDTPVAQRATEALGAQAMTVGHHIFAPPETVGNMRIMGHELSHANENLNGTPETGISNGAGLTVTDPKQRSEQKADKDGVFFGAGATTAPSVVAQRAVTQDAGSAAVDEDASTAGGAVQRAAQAPTVQRVEGSSRGHRDNYEADASSSGSDYDRRADSSPERGVSSSQAGAGSAAQSFMDGPSNPYRPQGYGRFEFESSSSSSGEEGRRPASPAPAPAPVQSSPLADTVYGFVHGHITQILTEGAEEEGDVTPDTPAMIDGWATYAAAAASAVLDGTEAAQHAEGSDEHADFMYRYPQVFQEVFTEHSDLLFGQQAERLAGTVMNRLQQEQRQNRRADRQGINLPENPALRPLRALLLRERLEDTSRLKVTLKVDAGNLLQGDVGHAWIEITGSDGKKVSFGFYPEGEDLPLLNNVPGGVMCPDSHRAVTQRESKKASLRRILDGYQIAYQKANEAYNLTQYNCTSFAGQVWTAMTGESIPRNLLTTAGLINMVAPNPAAAGAGLDRHQAPRLDRRRERIRTNIQGPMRGVLPGGNEDELADRMARVGLSQSSDSQSSEEVD
ncbi:eCIS core domain-containing protein [Streptomyces sp. NBC_01429]|uniref:eCIS core domain-containing protein n=1 Tax=Streptomyces sp. NBC_01429 TaxID=2903862 RepID=UPI002E2A1FEE|nr:DUF4157 domain-containing protein [Streptomyces sp. NBC_01429]